ncbi:hypothetical protein AXF42_Ash015433 [Apostasia shenzhenica]|uniref:Uncharacterized protein n=1 Tax=Apostasia shenzhenica TaxID=1088818 RepID=A0A2H9ZS70_9ASPA|nr:hypothetical protein AXF42_Ash015433 [Apostasia shenzhenica]
MRFETRGGWKLGTSSVRGRNWRALTTAFSAWYKVVSDDVDIPTTFVLHHHFRSWHNLNHNKSLQPMPAMLLRIHSPCLPQAHCHYSPSPFFLSSFSHPGFSPNPSNKDRFLVLFSFSKSSACFPLRLRFTRRRIGCRFLRKKQFLLSCRASTGSWSSVPDPDGDDDSDLYLQASLLAPGFVLPIKRFGIVLNCLKLAKNTFYCGSNINNEVAGANRWRFSFLTALRIITESSSLCGRNNQALQFVEARFYRRSQVAFSF